MAQSRSAFTIAKRENTVREMDQQETPQTLGTACRDMDRMKAGSARQSYEARVSDLSREIAERDGPYAISPRWQRRCAGRLVSELSRTVGGNYLTVHALKCLLREMQGATRNGSVRPDDMSARTKVREKNEKSWTGTCKKCGLPDRYKRKRRKPCKLEHQNAY